MISKNHELIERIASKYPMCDLLRYTDTDLYRLANRNADKWNGIKAVSAYSNINTDLAVAFGDDINDLDMLRNCGVGVAVGNAIPEAKETANFVCDANDSDGVAKWITKNIL